MNYENSDVLKYFVNYNLYILDKFSISYRLPRHAWQVLSRSIYVSTCNLRKFDYCSKMLIDFNQNKLNMCIVLICNIVLVKIKIKICLLALNELNELKLLSGLQILVLSPIEMRTIWQLSRSTIYLISKYLL